MNDRLQDHFQHYAEEIAEQNDGTCTIVRVEGTDCLYELEAHGETLRGWWRDGESLGDIAWKFEPAAGWPQELQ